MTTTKEQIIDIEIEHIITTSISLRKFFNLIMKESKKFGGRFTLDWFDFKSWNGQIHDCFNDNGTIYKFIAEFGLDSSYFFYKEFQA